MTTDHDDPRARGVEAWRAVMGSEPPPPDDTFLRLTTDHVFGTIWTRPNLSVRDRRLISLTTIAMAGQREPLGFHVAAAYRSGDLSADELDEWVVHLAHYGGWPIAATAYAAVREATAAPDPG